MKVKIVKKEVKTYIEHATCECGGEMIASESAIFGALLCGGINPEIEHKCNRCGKTAYLLQAYPNRVQEEI